MVADWLGVEDDIKVVNMDTGKMVVPWIEIEMSKGGLGLGRGQTIHFVMDQLSLRCLQGI